MPDSSTTPPTSQEIEQGYIEEGSKIQNRQLLFHRDSFERHKIYLYMLLSINCWLLVSLAVASLRKRRYLRYDTTIKIVFVLFMVCLCVNLYFASLLFGRSRMLFSEIDLSAPNAKPPISSSETVLKSDVDVDPVVCYNENCCDTANGAVYNSSTNLCELAGSSS